MPKPTILTLRGAKKLREKHTDGVTSRHMAKLTGLSLPRVLTLESKDIHKAEEPWLWEARRFCQVLNRSLIEMLDEGTNSLADIDTGFDLMDALDVWRTNSELPLRFGIRIAVRLGLSDPFELLDVKPVHRQLWDTLASGERAGAPGICPWCIQPTVGEPAHLPTCLPSLLWHPRNEHLSLIGVKPKPLKPHVARGGSKPGLGIKAFREGTGLTQEKMAESLSIAHGTYQRIEKLHDNLTQVLAEKIAATYKVPFESLYLAPSGMVAHHQPRGVK